jgi:hypothetical protein
MANKRTEKPVLHISLNPNPKDSVSDEDFKKSHKTIWNLWAMETSHSCFLSIPILNELTFISFRPALIVTKKLSDSYENYVL